MSEMFAWILRGHVLLLLLCPNVLDGQRIAEDRKVLLRSESHQDPRIREGGKPGSWSSWGPWVPCTRSCGGGVQVRTRSCQTVDPMGGAHGHMVSAFRPTVPQHSNPWWQWRNTTHLRGYGEKRGQMPGLRDSHFGHRDSGNKRIVPGKYGYGKMPYVMPLQTEWTQDQGGARARRLRQLPLQGEPSQSEHRNQPASPALSRASLYQPDPGQGTQWALVSSGACTGTQRQHRMCNTKPCPPGSRHIRNMQCSSYNSQPFMGRLYEWEPFTEVQGVHHCELNCRAVGFRFYVRQSEKVIDGTPCGQNEMLVCVEGTCQSLGCDGYLGSGRVMDMCGVCGGGNTTCRVVSGVFTHALTKVGYHKIVEIPEGATKINVTERIKSRNYLALRSRSGRSIINGQWTIDRPGKYEGAGTMFTYRRPSEISSTTGESILAEGPTNEILDVYMIYQQHNPGVHYEFILPIENPQTRVDMRLQGNTLDDQDRYIQPGNQNQDGYEQPPPVLDNQVPVPQTPQQHHEYNWKMSGMTDCSASCGRGSRYTVFLCIHKVTLQPVTESLCDSARRPSSTEEPCNTEPCPAFWDIGEWSECSRTCGPGHQQRQVLCRQVYANRTLNVHISRCRHLERPETMSTCQLKICSEWQIRTEWSACSVPCGVGQRSREVRCVSNVGDIVADEDCNMKMRPSDLENCDMGPCTKSWFFTDWGSQCSTECGFGVRTRSVLCLSSHISSLPLEGCGPERPPESQACNNGPCESQIEWFTGQWGQCSMECGPGHQQRDVVCLMKTEEGFSVVPPYECSSLERPPSQQSCQLKACGARWYHTDWSACSKTCEGGFRVREVRCLSNDMMHSEACEAHLQPKAQESCNSEPCVLEIDENCQDRYLNCNVVVQARLCVYDYYWTACCASCTQVAQWQSRSRGHR
ncbi:thrombospondin type-1 domain-containing protein 4 [Scleropages formosus]|uniref:thrombospondin type-1 domain-containing protein 4 n=1 Tax=Scleropages formosus TaxID=113540 RepID=UPI000878AD4E|nr:thrombospondin type-1 domain-containing protein 4-like [Scleropages formosus]